MRKNMNVRSVAARGFTLIELLLVLVILAILAGIVVPRFAGVGEQSRIKAAKAGISSIKSALDTYAINNNDHYPTTDEGLKLLIPTNLEKEPLDPWGTPYVYVSPGTEGHPFDIFSAGPDKQPNTQDDVQP